MRRRFYRCSQNPKDYPLIYMACGIAFFAAAVYGTYRTIRYGY
jgi:hypothetical protein